MATQNGTKLKILFDLLQNNNVITNNLLYSVGVSKDLRNYYAKSSWIEQIGIGAYKKTKRKIYWQDGINALQKQVNLSVFVGGLTALSIQGYSHYIRYEDETLFLFSPRGVKLPKWFKNYDWNVKIFHKNTSFLPYNIGLKDIETNNTKIMVSTPERSILECLYLAPDTIDLVETYHILEGLVNLKPKLLNELLKNCKSIKVKRLFLYMAEKLNHQWFNFIEKDKINLGSGTREITKNGSYISKYQIVIPKELSEL